MSAARAAQSFKLRAMRHADLDSVLALEEAIFPTPWSMNSYRFELERNPASELWVIEVKDTEGQVEIAAYTVCWLLVDELHIANIAVAAAYRRLGLGRRLMTHALERAKADGARSASLEVRASNLGAQALYAGFGFEVVGKRKAYYHDNREDALLMYLPSLEGVEDPTN
jgi:ribosomal-protein-alanine N-acetyltransferase